jgi:CRISPR-associated protein Cmr6
VARRDDLSEVTPEPATHAGLWLDRYLEDLDSSGGKQEHLDRTLSVLRVPTSYRLFFARWKAALRRDPDTLFARAQVVGRLIVGLGAESVLETSITLHRTYGLPYLPGSALKGLAAAAAHRRLLDPDWRKAGPERPIGPSHRLLFGDLASSGYVTFHDALWIPEGDRLPLDLDVLTVHHPKYYGGKEAPPADWDSPVPVPFASARGAYLLAVTGPAAWADAALVILSAALAEDGLGAKTAAGYGRFKVEREPVVRAPSWEERIKGLTMGFAGTLVPDVLHSLRHFPTERQRAALKMIELLGGRKSLRPHREKAWAKELEAVALRKTSGPETS